MFITACFLWYREDSWRNASSSVSCARGGRKVEEIVEKMFAEGIQWERWGGIRVKVSGRWWTRVDSRHCFAAYATRRRSCLGTSVCARARLSLVSTMTYICSIAGGTQARDSRCPRLLHFISDRSYSELLEHHEKKKKKFRMLLFFISLP